MVHPHDCVGTDGTVLFHGVYNTDDERSKQNKHVVENKDDGVDDSVDNSIYDCADISDDCANKHLTYLSQAVDCHLTERSKQNKH
eukprot:4791557-Ditylum_brightwellii.AAC.1